MTRPESPHCGQPPALAVDSWWKATWFVILSAGIGWIWFAAGNVTWYDSGELIAAAFHLGLSHPPGQPLYGQMGKLATLLPLGSVAFRCNLLSAAAGTAALVGLARLAHRSAGSRAALVSVTLAALTWPLAEQTMRAEVYTPVLASILWAFVLATDPGHRRLSNLGAAAILTGLAAGFHPLLAALAWLGLVVSIAADHKTGQRITALRAVLAGALVGNLIWLTVPTAGNRRALLPWTNPDSLKGILETITAQAYRQNLVSGRLGLSVRLIANARLLGELAGPVLTILAMIGLVVSILRDPQKRPAWPAWMLIAVGLISATALNVFYPLNPDLHGYLLPSILGLSLASAVGFVRLLDRTAAVFAVSRRSRITSLGMAVMGLALVASARYHAQPIADQTHRVGRSDEFVSAVGDSARPGPGLVVASSDHALFTLTYAKAIEQWRPDLALVSRWLVGARAPWYRRWIKRQWPWVSVPLLDDRGPTRGIRRRFEEHNAAIIPTYLEDPPEPLWARLRDCGLFFALTPKGSKKKGCVRKIEGPLVLGPIQAKLIGCSMSCLRARFLASRGLLRQAGALLEPFVHSPLPALAPLASEFLCTAARPLVLSARILIAEGKRSHAQKLLHRAIVLDPRFADSYVELGRLLAAEGRIHRAKRLVLRGLALEPTNVTALFYLALIEHRLGHIERARSVMGRAAHLDPGKVRLLLRAHGSARQIPPPQTEKQTAPGDKAEPR